MLIWSNSTLYFRMSFLKQLLAPDPTESDEDFLKRRLNDFISGNNPGSTLDDILKYTSEYKQLIGIKAWNSLVDSLSTFQKDPHNQNKALIILSELINDDSLESNSISGYIANDNQSLLKILECLSSRDSKVRANTLTLLKNLIRLQPTQVQNIFLDSTAQKLILGLEDDSVDAIRSSFYFLIPSLVKGNPDIQQVFAFSLIDPLADKILSSPNKVLPVIHSLLENNPKIQTLFVKTGHLGKLLPSIQNGDINSIDLLTLIFKSSEAGSFRPFLSETNLMNSILEQALSTTPNEKRRDFLYLLGYIIKGDEALCSLLSNDQIERLLTISISSNNSSDIDAGLFCLECFAIKLSSKLAETICIQMSTKMCGILTNYQTEQLPTSSLLSIASSCLISNHDTVEYFYGKKLSNDKCFFTNTIEILAVVPKSFTNLLVNLLIFSCAIIWESKITSKYFVSTLSTFQREDKQSSLIFLISLCQRDIDNSIRTVACLLILELLLFKTNDDAFAQLITAVRSHIGINELITTVDTYSKTLNEIEDNDSVHSLSQSQWSEFVSEAYRNIRRNKDGLLSQQAEIRSDSAQIANLQSQLSEITQNYEEVKISNEQMKKELDENHQMIEDLEQQVAEMLKANEMYESALNQSTQEKENLENEIEKIRSNVVKTPDVISQEQKVSEIQNEFNEMKEKLTKEITRLKEENQELRNKIQSSDVANQYMQENQDLKEHLKRSKQLISELSEAEEELKQAKAELARLYNGSQVVNTDEQIIKLQKEVEENKQTINDMLNEKNELMAKISSYQQNQNSEESIIDKEQIEQLQKEAEDNKQLAEEMLNEKEELTNKLNEIIQSHNDEIQQLKEANEATENDLVEAMENNELLQSELTKTQDLIKQYENEKHNSNEIEELHTLIENQKQEIDKITVEKDSIKSQKDNEIEQLNSLIENQKQQIIQLNSLKETEMDEHYKKENESLTKQIKELTEQSQNYIKENESLTKQIKKLTEQSQNYIQENESLTKQINELTDKNANIEQLYKNTKNELHNTQNELEEIQQKNQQLMNYNLNQTLTNQINELSQNNKQLIQNINEKDAEISNLKEINSKLQNEINEIKQKSEIELQTHQKVVDQYKDQIQSLKLDNQKVTDELNESIQNSQEINQEEMANHSKEIEKLNQIIQKLKDDQISKEKEISHLQEEIDHLKLDKQNEIEKIQNSNQNEIKKLQLEIKQNSLIQEDESVQQIQLLQDTVKKSEESIENLKITFKQKLAIKEKKIASLEDQLKTAREITQRKDKHISELEKLNTDIENDGNKRQIQYQQEQITKDLKISQLQEENKDLSLQISNMKDNLSQCEKFSIANNSSIELEIELKNAQATILEKNRLIEELQKSQVELAKKCKKEIHQYKLKAEHLENEDLKSKEDQIKRLNKTVDELQSKLNLNDFGNELTELSVLLDDEPIESTSVQVDTKEKLRTVSRKLTSIVSEYKILKSTTELQEEELKQTRINLQRQRENNQKMKENLSKAMLQLQKVKQNEILKKNSFDEDKVTIQRLKDDLNRALKEHNALQAKHQSALRLIGQLWTRNQSLLQKPSQLFENLDI